MRKELGAEGIEQWAEGTEPGAEGIEHGVKDMANNRYSRNQLTPMNAKHSIK
jgi:hypothetical protein